MTTPARTYTTFGDSIRPALPNEVGAALPLLPLAAPATRLVQIDGEIWAAEQQRARTAVREAAAPLAREDSWRAPPRLAPLTPLAEPHIEVDGQVVVMDEWRKGRPLGMPADSVDQESPEGNFASAVSPSTEVMRSAVIDGVTVEMDAVSFQLLELILRLAGAPEAEEAQTFQSGVGMELSE